MSPSSSSAARPHFVVPIHDLDVSGRDFAADVPAAWLADQLAAAESELAPAGPDGRLEAHVSRSGNDVVVRGRLRVDLKIPCARCLEAVEMHPDIDLSLLLVPATGARAAAARGAAAPRATAHRAGNGRGHDRAEAKRAKPAERGGRDREERDDDVEIAPEDADLDTYEGEEVVLDRFVREAVLLEEPIFPLCSETCEGIPPPPAPAEPPVSSPFASLIPRAKKSPKE